MAVNCPLGLRRITSDKDSGGKPALPSCSERADAAELLVGGAPKSDGLSIQDDFGVIWGVAGPAVGSDRGCNGFLCVYFFHSIWEMRREAEKPPSRGPHSMSPALTPDQDRSVDFGNRESAQAHPKRAPPEP
jgi:hypothetical protein